MDTAETAERPEDQPPSEGEVEAELAAQVADEGLQARLWLKAILPLLQMRSTDSDPSDRVQLAYDRMHIAACERVARILRSDLTGDQG